MSIKFNKIWFENFLSYSAKRTEITFEKGMNLLSGEVGQGKSAIIDALCYCLYGEPYRKIKIAQLINRKNKRKLIAGCEFESNNAKYIIERSIKPDKFFISKNDIELESLSSKKLLQEELDKILGINIDLFRHIVSLAISYNKPFLTLPLEKKREILEAIFNVNMFGDMMKLLKKDISNLKIEIEISEKEIAVIKETISEDRKRLIEINNSEKKFKENKESEIQNIQFEINNLVLRIDDLEKEVKEIEENKEFNLQELKQNIVNITDKLNTEKEIVAEKIKGIKNEIQVKKETNEKLLKEYRENIKITQEIYLKNKEILDGVLSSNKEKKLLEIKNIESDVLKLQEEIKDKASLLTDQSKYQNEIAVLKNDIKGNTERLNFYAKEDVCFYCKQAINKKEYILKETSEKEVRELEIKEIEKKLDVICTNIIKIEEIDNQIKDKNQLKDKIDAILDKNEQEYKNRIIELKQSFNENIADINNKCNKIENDVDIFKLENAVSDLSALKSIRDLEVKKHELEIRFENKDDEIQKLIKNKADIISLYKDNLKNGNDRLKETQSKEFNLNIKEFQNSFVQKCNNYKKKNIDFEDKQKKMNCFLTSQEILSDKGIKSYFFKKLIPVLNQKINEYLLSFDLPIRVEFNEVLQETISDLTGREQDISYYNFSGGERTKIDTSILFAFIELNKMLNNFDCNLLFIDELLDSQIDAKGLKSFLEYIRKMSINSPTSCYYIISHKVDDLEFFNNVYKINKKNGFSTIERQ